MAAPTWLPRTSDWSRSGDTPAGQQFPASTCGGLLCWRPVSLCKQQHTVGGLYKIKPGWIWRCIPVIDGKGQQPGAVRELVEAVDQKIPARTIARYGSLIQPFASPNHPTVSFSADKGCLIFALSPTAPWITPDQQPRPRRLTAERVAAHH